MLFRTGSITVTYVVTRANAAPTVRLVVVPVEMLVSPTVSAGVASLFT